MVLDGPNQGSKGTSVAEDAFLVFVDHRDRDVLEVLDLLAKPVDHLVLVRVERALAFAASFRSRVSTRGG